MSFIRNLFRNEFQKISRFYSTNAVDLQSYFVNPTVHRLLQKLVSASSPNRLTSPKYKENSVEQIKLLSDTELEAVKKFSSILIAQKLQMPPVMNSRPSCDTEEITISKDPKLCGFLPANQKLAFVDIGLESSRRRRLIVLREADGTLRHATSSERDRLNQVFFPLPGRRLRVPSLFQEAYLEESIKEGKHEYILDRILLQFEPDDPEYIRICHRVYDDLEARIWSYVNVDVSSTNQNGLGNPSGNFLNRLRYTRHYGPFALYVIAQLRRPESLIQDALSCQEINTVFYILRLSCLLQPLSEFAKSMSHNTKFTIGEAVFENHAFILDCVKNFINKSELLDTHRNQLELTLLQCIRSNEWDALEDVSSV